MSADPAPFGRPPRVLYPGSFDPLHLGHLDVIEQANELFGDVVVAVMYNFAKPSGMFDVDERVALIERAVVFARLVVAWYTARERIAAERGAV